MKINFEAKNKFSTIVYENSKRVSNWVDHRLNQFVEGYVSRGYGLDELNVSVDVENYYEYKDHVSVIVCAQNQHTSRRDRTVFCIGFDHENTKQENEKVATIHEWIALELKERQEAKEAEEALRVQEVAVEAADEE